MAIADAKFIVSEASDDLNNEILSQNIANLNIIRNGSFEDWSGDTPFQWSKIGTPTEVVRDTGDRDNFGVPYAARITSAGSNNEGLQYTLSKLKPSTTYSVYARAKATSGYTAKIWTTGAGTNLSQTTTSTAWATLVGTFVTDSTPTDVVLKIGSDTSTDIVWFDSIMVVEGTAPFAFAPNPVDYEAAMIPKICIPSKLVTYKYRKSVTINGSSDGAQTNYQLKVTINRTIGTDSGSNVYVNDKCLSNYNDIRFTTLDNTLLDYWIESSDSVSAVIWVEFDSIPTTEATFYMYYGNANASAYSNGDNTFIWFDDFSTAWNNPVKWTGDTASATVTDGEITLSTTGASKIIMSNVGKTGNVAMRARLNIIDANTQGVGLSKASWDGDEQVYLEHNSGEATHSRWYTTSSGANKFSTTAGGFGTYHIYDFCRVLTGTDTARAFLDGTQINGNVSANVPTQDEYVWLRAVTTNPSTIKADWVLLRNYTTTEPAWGTWGDELLLTNPPSIIMANMISGCRPKYNTARILNIEKGTLVIDGYLAIVPAEIFIDATDGPNNWETGSVYTSTWSHVYLIKPASSGGIPTYKLSNTTPSASTTGGARYHPSQPTWRFVGSFYINNSSQLTRFYRVGNWILWGDVDPANHNVLSGGTSTAYAQVSLGSYNPTDWTQVPATATAVRLYVYAQHGSTGAAGQASFVYVAGDSNGYGLKWIRHEQYGSTYAYVMSDAVLDVPLLETQKVYYKHTGSSAGYISVSIDVHGFYEEV